MDWRADFIEVKYHLTVAKRLMAGYEEYPEKRFLVGVINESARAVASLVRAFLIYDNVKRGNLKKFFTKIAPKYLDAKTIENLAKTLEIKRAQKKSPIQFAKKDNIILLIRGRYRFLTADRIKEFLDSVDDGILAFPGDFRQV